VDSHELIGRSGGNRWIPLAAIVQDDFRQIIRHWAYLIWAGLAIVLPLLWLMNASNLTPGAIAGLLRHVGNHEVAKQAAPAGTAPTDDESDSHVVRKPQPQDGNYVPWAQDAAARRRSQELASRPYQEDDQAAYASGRSTTGSAGSASASQLGAKLLGMHLLVWIGLAVSLGASTISSEFASIGESVMCWGVARWQYFLGKLAARAFASMVLVVVVTLPMLLVFNAKANADLAFWPSIQTTLFAACVVGCVAAMGVSIGVWFRSSMRAVGVSIISLFVVGAICTFLAPVAYSPMAMVENLPSALRGVEGAATNSVLSFSSWGAGGLAVVSLGKFMWTDL
jgi:hypothetical protein